MDEQLYFCVNNLLWCGRRINIALSNFSEEKSLKCDVRGVVISLFEWKTIFRHPIPDFYTITLQIATDRTTLARERRCSLNDHQCLRKVTDFQHNSYIDRSLNTHCNPMVCTERTTLLLPISQCCFRYVVTVLVKCIFGIYIRRLISVCFWVWLRKSRCVSVRVDT